ncbi:MAG: rRNA pseudouridine synthase [Thermotogae bacterium]|nr:rRNA pseudouridine synthase [Thermotogota bacterium]
MRLLQYLQQFYGFSRRKAFRFIRKGKVRVGPQVITQPLYEVPEGAEVHVEGYIPGGLRRMMYVAFHKPPGLVVSRKDPHNPTIYTILPEEFRNLRAVGRLDKYSEGLLLLTNDGLLLHRLTHPKYGVPREYIVRTDPPPDGEVIEAVLRGIEDEGELLRAHEADITADGLLRVVLRQGKYREIRRMMGRLGRRVRMLRRISYGGVRLDIPKGEWRLLRDEEVASLKEMVGL